MNRRERWAEERLADPNFEQQVHPIPGGKVRHVSETCWVVECHSCMRNGRGREVQKKAACESLEDSIAWMETHLGPDSKHWQVRYPSSERVARLRRVDEETAYLKRIFGLNDYDSSTST